MPALIPAAIGAVGSLGAGAIGAASASSDRAAAAAARQQALEQFLKINVPDPEQQKIILEHYKTTGQMSPELEHAFQQSQTELNNVSLDPSTREAEMNALSRFQDISNNGGADSIARSKEQAALNAANTNEKGQRDAIVQRYAQMGQAGSGAQLQAELAADQGDANQAASLGLQSAADDEQRALAAMASGASIGAQVHGQDYQQQSDQAKAQDAINQFNTRNSQGVQNANVTAQNQAQQYNLNNQQRVSDLNTGTDNTQEMHNKDLIQQQFNNQTTKAAGASGQYAGVANQATADADRTAGQWAGVGQAIAQGAGAVGQNQNNQANLDAYNKRTDAMSAGKEGYGDEEV